MQMTRGRTGNSKFLKAYNETGILDLIRTKQAVSRADLSKETGLSPTATGVIVSSLIEREYIHEVGTGESSGGRKPVLLELKPDSWYSVGLDIEVDIIQFVLMDITSRVLHEGSIPLRVNTPEMAVMASAACVRNIMRKFSIKGEAAGNRDLSARHSGFESQRVVWPQISDGKTQTLPGCSVRSWGCLYASKMKQWHPPYVKTG